MRFKTLDDFDFRGKTVLLRSDLNSPLVRGRVLMNDRIGAASKTVRELKKSGARVVILAHQGRPGKKDFVSLKNHAKLLGVNFVDDLIGRKAVSAISLLRLGDALLLENVRALKEEFLPSVRNDLVRILSPFFDVFVNDAFSVCHRNQTSVVSFAKVLPSCIGRNLEKELKALKKIKLKNCLFVLGGGKVEDKSLLIGKGKKTLLTGEVALAYGNRRVPKNVVKPIDFVSNGEDIGPKTIEIFSEEILKAKCIFLSGPPGVYEQKRFSDGTRKILRAVAKSKGFSLVGGGDTVAAIHKFKIPVKSFGYVSLAGGALVQYLAGRKLPGIEVLKKKGK